MRKSSREYLHSKIFRRKGRSVFDLQFVLMLCLMKLSGSLNGYAARPFRAETTGGGNLVYL